MEKDTASRKWQITINNPVEKGFTHDRIKELLTEFRQAVYWCMSDEIGEEGTPHTHIYLHSACVVRFSSVRKRFDGAHLEMAKGTAQQNKDYVMKTGRWLDTRKHETCIDGTFEEFGDVPVERQGKRNDLDDLYSMIKDGMSDFEILEQDASYILHMDKIDRARQTVRQETYKNTWRNVDVTYIYGDTGSGKTRGVMERYGYENVFRVTDYLHPFDNYKGQDVVVFEEFRSSLRIGDMLNYLDGYPLELPCRYANKYACFTKVYIISNLPLSQQYSQLQIENYESYRAFLRRISGVQHYTGGCIEYSKIEMLSNGFRLLLDDEKTPFDDANGLGVA
ncbi:hypothetical protein [Clostridium sp. AN503]|uniref:hypothetical protein n=1 Tax=Clostridium sp. AN503 TaxID=3160598 RepID=UPI00345A1A19